FGGNEDWPQNNWYASRRRIEGAKWQFHSWDTEFFFINLSSDRVNTIDSSGPGELFTNLLTSDEFRLRFADRIQLRMLGDGVLSPARNIARLDGLTAPLNGAVVGESARWGDAWMNQVSPARTRDDDWLPKLDKLRSTYFPQRNAIVMRQYVRRGLFPATQAVTLSHSGGLLDAGTVISFSAAEPSDLIYYTVDGSDPRLVGGALSPSAVLYSGSLTIEASLAFQIRVLRGTEWSPLIAATYEVPTVGDFDGDNRWTVSDLDRLCAAVLDRSTDLQYDLNQDAKVNVDDHRYWVEQIKQSTLGDANLDGVFNSSDLVLIFQAGLYEDALDRNSTWATGDWNCDGEFTTSDLVAAFQTGAYQ
ncbi:MAG: CotH kinase family protein, partial [Planctomycetales bacterium]|nr:CotH kinase family protein [Planctomycetales bacterium]